MVSFNYTYNPVAVHLRNGSGYNIVFADTDEFTIRIKKGKSIILSDGRVIAALPENGKLHIKKAPFTADFPVKNGSDFFARVRNKLG